MTTPPMRTGIAEGNGEEHLARAGADIHGADVRCTSKAAGEIGDYLRAKAIIAEEDIADAQDQHAGVAEAGQRIGI